MNIIAIQIGILVLLYKIPKKSIDRTVIANLISYIPVVFIHLAHKSNIIIIRFD